MLRALLATDQGDMHDTHLANGERYYISHDLKSGKSMRRIAGKRNDRVAALSAASAFYAVRTDT